jgi:hypothetical protein
MTWTRRDFLNTSMAGAALYSIAPAATAASLSDAERATLKVTVDEIVPAGDGMPAASQIGGVAYIEKLIATEPRGMGKVLHQVVRYLNAAGFTDLSQPERVSALKKLEASDTASFTLLRDSVYEAYYTNPQIWKKIGYELYPTDHAGPHMKPFDESAIAVVRQKPRYYRDA